MFEIMLTFMVLGDATYWPEDYGDSIIHHEDLFVWECTDPAPEHVRHINCQCEVWVYDYGDDEGDE